MVENNVSMNLVGIFSPAATNAKTSFTELFPFHSVSYSSSEVCEILLSLTWIKYTFCISEEPDKPQALQYSSCRATRLAMATAKLLFCNGTGLF